METAELDRILCELCDLLQCQIEALVGREFNDFSEMELDAYLRRKRRILELQPKRKNTRNQFRDECTSFRVGFYQPGPWDRNSNLRTFVAFLELHPREQLVDRRPSHSQDLCSPRLVPTDSRKDSHNVTSLNFIEWKEIFIDDGISSEWGPQPLG